ncbi:MAG: succinate dehydrogenase assembly factor 2 [Tabrizicola sp.]|jgi:antitoxin CptB|nr:succinate dehydrogenase assembly factor 2 [Tabrizicola sp.]
MIETAEARLKRVTMRSWRRGTKEMDLILGPFADASLAGLSEAELDLYDALLAENDQDLMAWILGQSAPPERFSPLLQQIAQAARSRLSGRK